MGLRENQGGHNPQARLPGRVVEATYRDQVLNGYAGNPFIEALPDILSQEEVVQLLMRNPEWTPAEASLNPKYRIHCPQRLKNQWRYPFAATIEFEQSLSLMIRHGYLTRNIFSAHGQRCLYHMGQGEGWLDFPDLGHNVSSCIFVSGLSGMGKTTMVNSVLSLYPQHILHSKYRGQFFNWTQVVWLRVECPPDGSRSGFCLEFFSEVDRVVGTDYLKQFSGRHKLDVLVSKMGQIASVMSLGVLIIDEVQNLTRAKGGGANEFLAFLRSLNNKLGLPIVLIGTFAARDLFVHCMQDGRRASDEGIIVLKQPSKSSKQWKRFLDVMQLYQWLPKPEPFPEKLRDTLYDLSQGITDYAVRLIVFAQRMAINEGIDTLSVNLLKRAYKQHFQLLEPALSALRSGSSRKMKNFDDLVSLAVRNSDEAALWLNEPDEFTIPNESAPSVLVDDAGHLADKKVDEQHVERGDVAPVDSEQSIVPLLDSKDVRIGFEEADPHEALKRQGLVATLGPEPVSISTPSRKPPRKF